MFKCLLLAGCERTRRTATLFECTRTGYCKEGYCAYRDGDVTPNRRFNRGILVDVVSPVAQVPCIGGCSNPTIQQLEQQSTRAAVYRLDEPKLPARHGDPRLGVNQNYDGMPYSIPYSSIPVPDNYVH